MRDDISADILCYSYKISYLSCVHYNTITLQKVVDYYYSSNIFQVTYNELSLSD